ncbi:helix-turn-helix domain-containing protein [Saccharopolyspora mangrovi]|uniref:Winged helix-turn-helix domain-containing protein n=1 Tax=Saccharopolyspora mangrovi TaxID=3082379 RepID=A0ABU6AF73_9PSEU|nr:winged helix-turn-helix domain-containing protein [Saccharopolyspora sp. S2-29]MEB3370112.1 winged helix-turn-helix domain-containing protein [Saccharopolyspora sp. S2-29]
MEREKSLHGGARSLSADALQKLRRQVVAEVESGLSMTYVAENYGISRKSVGKWVREYRSNGERAFVVRKKGRRAGSRMALLPSQQGWVLQAISAGSPERAGLPYLLWTRRAVAELIRDEFGTSLSPATIDQYLVRWGLTTKSLPTFKPGELPEPSAGVQRMAAAWVCTQPMADFGPIHVLLAVTGRGLLFFELSTQPFNRSQLTDFRQRLRMQLGRAVALFIRAWPPEAAELREALSGIRQSANGVGQQSVRD